MKRFFNFSVILISTSIFLLLACTDNNPVSSDQNEETLIVDARQNALVVLNCGLPPATLNVPAGSYKVTLSSSSLSTYQARGDKTNYVLVSRPLNNSVNRDYDYVTLNGTGASKYIDVGEAGNLMVWFIAQGTQNNGGQATITVAGKGNIQVDAKTNVIVTGACGSNPAKLNVTKGTYKITLESSTLSTYAARGDKTNYVLISRPLNAGIDRSDDYFTLNGVGASKTFEVGKDGNLLAWFLAQGTSHNGGKATLRIIKQ